MKKVTLRSFCIPQRQWSSRVSVRESFGQSRRRSGRAFALFAFSTAALGSTGCIAKLMTGAPGTMYCPPGSLGDSRIGDLIDDISSAREDRQAEREREQFRRNLPILADAIQRGKRDEVERALIPLHYAYSVPFEFQGKNLLEIAVTAQHPEIVDLLFDYLKRNHAEGIATEFLRASVLSETDNPLQPPHFQGLAFAGDMNMLEVIIRRAAQYSTLYGVLDTRLTEALRVFGKDPRDEVFRRMKGFLEDALERLRDRAFLILTTEDAQALPRVFYELDELVSFVDRKLQIVGISNTTRNGVRKTMENERHFWRAHRYASLTRNMLDVIDREPDSHRLEIWLQVWDVVPFHQFNLADQAGGYREWMVKELIEAGDVAPDGSVKNAPPDAEGLFYSAVAKGRADNLETLIAANLPARGLCDVNRPGRNDGLSPIALAIFDEDKILATRHHFVNKLLQMDPDVIAVAAEPSKRPFALLLQRFRVDWQGIEKIKDDLQRQHARTNCAEIYLGIKGALVRAAQRQVARLAGEERRNAQQVLDSALDALREIDREAGQHL